MQIHLQLRHFLGGNRFLDSLHKSFLIQTTLDLRKKKWTSLNREFTVVTKMKICIVMETQYIVVILFPTHSVLESKEKLNCQTSRHIY